MDFDTHSIPNKTIYTGFDKSDEQREAQMPLPVDEWQDCIAPTIKELEDKVLEEQNKAYDNIAEERTVNQLPLSSLLFVAGPLFLFASMAITISFSQNEPFKKPEIFQISAPAAQQMENHAYKITRYEDQSYDVFFKGVLTGAEEDQSGLQKITLNITDDHQQISPVVFVLPVDVIRNPQPNEDIHFTELFTKGIHSINIRIRYDKEQKLLGWELIHEEK